MHLMILIGVKLCVSGNVIYGLWDGNFWEVVPRERGLRMRKLSYSMGSRRNIPTAYDERIIHRSEMARREQIPRHVLLEEKFASQAAEIKRLARDNHTLASSHLVLRQDLVAAKREAEKLREHIGSIQNEGDIEIRIQLDKIVKMEIDIRAGENIKKEIEEACVEARNLVKERLELTTKIQQATIELDNCRANVKRIPEMQAKLDNLRQEQEKLRTTFEYEKGLNIKKVEEMKSLEKDLIGMVEEVERLRAKVLNAENGASALNSQSVPNINSENLFPPLFHGNGDYLDSFSGPHLQTIHGAVVEETNPYTGSGYTVGPQDGTPS
ncbi:hypothetical protein CASFOL_013806 [Castilleja foliolosa]|uniref:Uncharacterized protein n=1 Tax=Castilleja foliolosa TaxID=1961234 RepID=A0ABD3DMT4_9LAMI